MDKTFDDLYDEFVSELYNIEEITKRKADIEEIFKMLEEHKNDVDSDSMSFNVRFNNVLLEKLGEPNKVERVIKGDITYEEKSWLIPTGEFSYVLMIPSESFSDYQDLMEEEKIREEIRNKPLTLEEQLEIAIESEDWSLAIELRDKIKTENNSK